MKATRQEFKGWIAGGAILISALFFWLFFIIDDSTKLADNEANCITVAIQQLNTCITACAPLANKNLEHWKNVRNVALIR